MGSILDCGEDAWDKIFDINVKSALMLTQLCVPHMIDRGGGSIVYVTSIAGSCWTALRGGGARKIDNEYHSYEKDVEYLLKGLPDKTSYISIYLLARVLGYVPINLLGAYSVSKTALLGLTKVVSTAVCDENIRVNGIAPGIIKTKFSSALTANEDIADQTLAQIPLGRFGESSEIAGVASFLCSDDAAYITGETIVAAGGMMSHL